MSTVAVAFAFFFFFVNQSFQFCRRHKIETPNDFVKRSPYSNAHKFNESSKYSYLAISWRLLCCYLSFVYKYIVLHFILQPGILGGSIVVADNYRGRCCVCFLFVDFLETAVLLSLCLFFYILLKNISRTSAVSSTNFRSILIFASCVYPSTRASPVVQQYCGDSPLGGLLIKHKKGGGGKHPPDLRYSV